MIARSALVVALATLAAGGALACARDSEGEPARGPGANGAPGAPGGSGARGGGRAGGRGAGGPSIVLAATDVGPARRGPLESGVQITGDLRPIESVDVKARLEGDLTKVYVREGDRVRVGQLLARFESSREESGRRSAEADVASARSELATAQWNAEQSAELFRAGAIAERDQRTAQQAVLAARARVAAAEAALRSTSSSLGDTRVLAPTTGVVARRLVEDGEHLSRGASMFTVVRSDVLELAASVPARFANDVAAGQPARFTADGRRIDGRVARVSPTVDPATRAVTVYIQVPNPDGRLKGNSFATGRVIGRTIPDAVFVPSSAIRDVPDGAAANYVFRVAGDRLARVPVTVGVVDEERAVTQILSGLAAGDLVVVGNAGTLGDGMKVQIVGERAEKGSDQKR
jgi:RND family efflux transporter MFP subunit